MCGRFTLAKPAKSLQEHFQLDAVPDLPSRYNVAPTQNVAAIRAMANGRAFSLLRWGLILHWASDMKNGNRLRNARAETVASKPSFRSAFKQRRCLIAADGFYKWQKKDGSLPAQAWTGIRSSPHLSRLVRLGVFLMLTKFKGGSETTCLTASSQRG